MKIICAILMFVLAVFTLAEKPLYDLYKAPELFEKFIKDYNRNYKDLLDEEAHYNAFVANLIEINRSNRKSLSDIYDINNFADNTPEENQKSYDLLDEESEEVYTNTLII